MIKSKVTQALKQNKQDFARIHAESAIRKHNEALNYLRISSRIDGVVSRLKTAKNMKALTKDMTKVNSALGSAMKTMDLEKIQMTMDRFESQFEKLDLHSSVMENSLGQSMATTTPQDQVDALINKVAAENDLQIQLEANSAPQVNAPLPSSTGRTVEEEQELERKLAQLRG